MSLNKNKISLYFIILFPFFGIAQEHKNDSTEVEQLSEVVITGQYNPQSIKRSVHNVIVIKREQIENQAANNLADLLNFNLNLTITANSQTGKSNISFFGLDEQYFNILIDNIPLVSDNGLGNNTDLTQINLDDVERIEIVEGAMGVEYGANAVSGVINIITKKSIESDWKIQASLQEETVSDEYAWFDEGRHIQSVNVAHNINEKWFTKVGFNRNQFAGFLNHKKGEDYYFDDGLRGYDWLPKTQINTNALLHYKSDKFRLNYRFEYFNEKLNFYDASVRANIDVENQTSNPSATDKIYNTNRFVNNVNINGQFNAGANYKASFSYQQQQRDLNTFNYYILTEDTSNETDETYQSTKVFFSNGSINNLIKRDHFNFQLGYETRYIEGFDTQATGFQFERDKTQSIYSIATYGSAEYQFTDQFSLRPGLRYEYNSKFNSKLLASLSARHLMNNGFELRLNVGTSYRTPNFEELYYYFVDSNHDVQGNENLEPESGYSAFLNLKKRSWINDVSLLNAIKVSYLDLSDKIELAVVNTTPLQYKYINIDAYRLWGLTSENTIKTDLWTFNLGATLQGISRVINSEEHAKDNFLYAIQLNTSSTYTVPKWNTAFTLLLKYNGEQQNYLATSSDNEGNAIYTKATTDGYGLLDASIKKFFFDNKFQVTVGGRNLLDVTNVSINNASTGGTHASNNSALLLGYGRSYYLKLLYNLNF
ncbi:TonB-dependent receptor plug domain-containing protein [Lacinutrix iliipiscaria]|uniref:TonB-dependent receptor plug domain-containing protein n=1 Tax=Lacinutrix iliipiscaria TaxID=1230532 RepID=A0ABW5WK39_9FLAO